MYVFVVDGEIPSDDLIRFAYKYYVNKRNIKKKDDFEIIRRVGEKPKINHEGIFFSLSHSKNKIAIAISESNVGIDIEWGKERDYNKFEFIGARTKEEFYTRWTKHEAYYKFLGTGLRKENIDSCMTYSTFVLNDSYYLSVCSRGDKIELKEITPSEVYDGLEGNYGTR